MQDMTELVVVALVDQMSDWETGLALSHVRDPAWQRAPGRYEVVTVAEERRKISTTSGMSILPDATLHEVDPERCAMLVLSGADSWVGGSNEANQGFTNLARDMLGRGRSVASICGSTVGLARAGLFDDREHTSNAREFLEGVEGYRGAGLYREAPVVEDRGLITAGAMSWVSYTAAVLDALGLYEPAVLDAWRDLFQNGNGDAYFDLYRLTAASASAP
jgi:putative intracellular protease/amidase